MRRPAASGPFLISMKINRKDLRSKPIKLAKIPVSPILMLCEHKPELDLVCRIT